MQHLGMSMAELRAFHATLRSSHSVRIRVDVMDLNENVLHQIGDDLIDGQVNLDTTAAVHRSASLTVRDPHRALHFDSRSPAKGALYLDRMVKVFYCVKDPDGSPWVDVPVFTGPITNLQRNDDQIEIDAQGKELLAMNPIWHPITFIKGHEKVNAIRTLLSERAGETRFDFPPVTERLPRPHSLGRMQHAWGAAHALARSMDLELFYNGDGRCIMRRRPRNAHFTFFDGEGGNVMTAPQVTYSTEGLKNTVWMVGGRPRRHDVKNPKGVGGGISDKMPRLEYVAIAPHSHPLSPQSLGRNGVSRHLVVKHSNSHIRTLDRLKEVAHDHLDRLLLEATSVSFDALPIPHLDPLDMVRVNTDTVGTAFVVRQFSIPLHAGDTMSLGYNRRVRAHHLAHHRHRAHHRRR